MEEATTLKADDKTTPPADDGVAWGAREIGETISRTERQAFHLLEAGHVKSARKVGAIWTAGKRALRREFGLEG